MGALEEALATPAGAGAEAWAAGTGSALTALQDAVERHITATEADDGLLAEVVSVAPRLAHRVDDLRDDHLRLRADLAALAPQVSGVTGADDVSAARDASIGVLARLVRHRHLGAELVYDAFNVDINAAD
jgi:hypothetical protein